MEKNLEQEIKEVVTSIFSEKEEADSRRLTEEALNASANTIEELTTTLEGKNSELADLDAKHTDAEERITDLETQLEAAKTEVQTSNEELTETKKQIEDMVKDKAADGRIKDLEEAGVARTDRDGQRSKVREMDDEEFAAYKDELVSIRASIMAELKEAAEEVKEEVATEEEEETAEEEEKEEASEEEEVETPPANVDPNEAMVAALNLDVFPADEMIKKYGDLGKAMAAAFKPGK
jgi:DNA repair exonuclease SbcCD ATPase subunit